MSTRANIDIRYGGRDKSLYVHSDGYPDATGKRIIDAIRTHTDDQFVETFGRMTPVNDNATPSIADVQRYGDRFANVKNPNTWYWLINKAQGDLAPLLDGDLDHYVPAGQDDGVDWRYVIDLDNRVLVIVGGRVTDTVSFDRLRGWSDDDLAAAIRTWLAGRPFHPHLADT